MYAKLRVYLHEQMDVVGHDFHLYDVDVVFAADFLYEFLQAYIDTVDQDLAAVFWTPDYMILAGVHHIVIAFIFHGFIILEMSRNVQSGNTQNLKSSAAPVRLPAAPASTPGTSQAVAQAGCVYRP